jgi:hypothetical protein
MNTPPYNPIVYDYSKLIQGSVISFEEIEKAVGVSPTDQRWPFALMKFKDFVEKSLHNQGKFWFLRQSSYTLRVMTDVEASNYQEKGMHIGIRKVMNTCERARLISTVRMSPQENIEHVNRLSKMAMVHASLKETVKIIRRQKKDPILDQDSEDDVAS